MANKVIELQKECEELSTNICSLCKPLMLDKKYKKHISQLLSSESDLRLTIELALECESAKECLEKLTLAHQESEIILYFLMQLDAKEYNTKDLISKTSNIIETLNNIIN